MRDYNFFRKRYRKKKKIFIHGNRNLKGTILNSMKKIKSPVVQYSKDKGNRILNLFFGIKLKRNTCLSKS